MEKLFDQDKNYILKQAQFEMRNEALHMMTDVAVECYLIKNNPLGLVDDLVLTLTNPVRKDVSFLKNPYQLLSAIYRLLHSDNQLEFSWTGKTHFEVFTEEWKDALGHWMQELCVNSYMDRLIIKGAIVHPELNPLMLEAQINKLIYQKFPVRKGRKGLLVAA